MTPFPDFKKERVILKFSGLPGKDKSSVENQVKLIYQRIYSRGEQVAVHARDYRPGKYSYEPGHLCSHHRHYLDRSPEYYIRQAGKKSQMLAQLITLIFEQDEHPEVLYRSCDGLFSLQRKTDPLVFENACTKMPGSDTKPPWKS